MLAKRLIPCLDVRDGKVVKGVQFRNHEIIGDIVPLAQRYAEAGADELVFYDITASSDGRVVDKSWVKRIAEVIDIPFCVAGGIKTVADAGKIPGLDATGRLDTSVMPVGIGADTTQAVASEARVGCAFELAHRCFEFAVHGEAHAAICRLGAVEAGLVAEQNRGGAFERRIDRDAAHPSGAAITVSLPLRMMMAPDRSAAARAISTLPPEISGNSRANSPACGVMIAAPDAALMAVNRILGSSLKLVLASASSTMLLPAPRIAMTLARVASPMPAAGPMTTARTL